MFNVHTGRPLDKILSLNTTETGLFGAPMDFGNLLDPSLDTDQVASAFNVSVFKKCVLIHLATHYFKMCIKTA